MGIEARVMGPHEQLTFPLAYGGLLDGILSFPTSERLERSPEYDQRDAQSRPQAMLQKNYENVTAIHVQPALNGDLINEDDRWLLRINGFRWESPNGQFRMSEAPDEIRWFIEASGMPDGTLNLSRVDFMQVFIPARFHMLDHIGVEYQLADGVKHLCKTPMNVKTLMFLGMTQALELHFEGQGVASLWIDGELVQSTLVADERPSPIYFSLSHADRFKRQEVWDSGVPVGVTAVNLSRHTVHLHTSQELRFHPAIAHTYTKNAGPLPLA